MKFAANLLVLVLATSLFTGCLRTRGNVREVDQRQVMQEQVSTLQQRNADSSARFSEVQETLRDQAGRISNLEAQLAQSSRQDQGNASLALEQNQALKRQVDLLQEEMGQLQNTLAGLQQQMSESRAAAPSSASSSSSKKSSFDAGDEYFKKEDWKRAIVAFQKFRDDSPKNSKVPEAIYRIGVSFQELGLKDEAKAFFDEAIAKYPTAEAARKSKIRLKSLR